MLEPFSAEVHSSLLSARGSLLSASAHMAAEAVDCRLSYRDMLLIKVPCWTLVLTQVFYS